MLRRGLAFYIVLCLLTTFFTPSAPPMLVCRMTGQPMPPVVADAENRDSCCAVAVTVGADGTRRYTLTRPGCCDLRVSSDHGQPPTVRSATIDFGPLIVWLPVRSVLPIPRFVEIVARPIAYTRAAPRAPPPRAVSIRGPPSFS